MSDHVPAWKRIGLKVQKELSQDPLAITTTVDPTKLSTKQVKKLKRSIAELDDGSNKNNSDGITTLKKPKRPKLPKDKRPPPPERDQLVYLRQFTEDRDNWKFAKSKQNWILKNVLSIELKYDEFLWNYLKSVQGGSKDRLVEEMKKVCDKWNVLNEELEKKVRERLEQMEKMEEEESGKKEEEKTGKKKAEEEDSNGAPEYDHAVKARNIVEVITGEKVPLKGVDEEEKEEEKISGEEKENEDEEKNGNLVIEEVEVTDYLNSEDYEDPEPESETVDDEALKKLLKKLLKKEKKLLKKLKSKEKKEKYEEKKLKKN